MPRNRLSLSLTALLTTITIVLTACGGGGGGGGGGSGSASPSGATAGPTFTLSGTISLPETAMVDSDTNDTFQANRVSDNAIPLAQAITTPIQLVGTVNVLGQGPVGANAAGDSNDYFKTSLTQGQVIELTFIGNGVADDVELHLIDDATGMPAGNDSSSAASKCLKIGRTGSYYIRIYAFSGSALYTMRISAPGEATCSLNSTSVDSIMSGELVAKLSARASTVTRGEIMQAAALETVDGETRERAHLLRLPRSEEQRAKGLARLERWGKRGVLRNTGNLQRDFPGRFRRAQRAMETIEYAKRLMATGLYDYVEPNFRLEMLATYAPIEPLYAAQRWSYQQINQPSAIDRIVGLSLPGSTQRPIVAVIDSGIVSNHPDLQAQITDGYSFISSSTSMPGDGNTANGDDPSVPSDTPRWHGTHVAGTVAALDANSKFGAGVAPQALLMPLRVFSPGRSASSYDIIQAIRYAAGLSNSSITYPSRKADVINMSLGASGSCPIQFANEIANARAQGVVVVAAAGNDARNDMGVSANVSFPANCNGVIAVGALDARKQQTFYSNSGPTLRLMAPGGDSYQSTTGTGYVDAIYSTLGSFDSTGRIASFGPLMGTSMASPHVAGVIALMRYVHPTITPSDIDTLIANGDLTDDLATAGPDNATGYGLINARKAVDKAIAQANGAASPAGIVVASPAAISFGSLSTTATLELKLTAPSTEIVSSIVSSSAAVTVTATSIDATTKLGTYTLNVSRSSLLLGTSFPTLTVTTNQRSFSVQLTIVKVAPGASSAANYGRLFIQVSNAATGARLGQVNLNPTNGKYVWSISGIPAGQIRMVAGTDLNYNRYFCDFGEICSVYPDTADSITVAGNLAGLDFAVSPTGMTASSLVLTPILKSGGAATDAR